MKPQYLTIEHVYSEINTLGSEIHTKSIEIKYQEYFPASW